MVEAGVAQVVQAGSSRRSTASHRLQHRKGSLSLELQMTGTQNALSKNIRM